jgi:hypothetical protein
MMGVLFSYVFALLASLPWVVMAKAKPLCYGNGQMHMVMYKNNHGK